MKRKDIEYKRMAKIAISLDVDTLDKLDDMVKEEDRNRSNMVVIAIKEAYQRRYEPRPEIAP
jgi:metal-responsive CopG/Arc/MetJ family transcriptional regulator